VRWPKEIAKDRRAALSLRADSVDPSLQLQSAQGQLREYQPLENRTRGVGERLCRRSRLR
jgi:hypothetical protein